jgi:hypothetical protein
MIESSSYFELVKEEFLKQTISDESLQNLISLTLEFVNQQEKEVNKTKSKVYFEDAYPDEEESENDRKWRENEPIRKENYITGYFKLLRQLTSWLKADYIPFDILKHSLNKSYYEDISLPKLKVNLDYVYPDGWNWMLSDGKVSVYFDRFSYYHNQESIDKNCLSKEEGITHPGWWGYKFNYQTSLFTGIELTRGVFYRLMSVRTGDNYVI